MLQKLYWRGEVYILLVQVTRKSFAYYASIRKIRCVTVSLSSFVYYSCHLKHIWLPVQFMNHFIREIFFQIQSVVLFKIRCKMTNLVRGVPSQLEENLKLFIKPCL